MNSGQLLFQNVNLNLLTEILLPVANGLLNFGKFNFFQYYLLLIQRSVWHANFHVKQEL